jgi:triosephosphate isomerase
VRRPLIVANWKMHKTRAQAAAFVHQLIGLGPDLTHVDAVICPPFTALTTVREALGDRPIGVGAQTMWWDESGAYTGEISPLMVADTGATWVILGHSERRQYCQETDAAVNRKLKAALHTDLTPIIAVGESAEEHAAGQTESRVVAQTRAAFADVAGEDVARCVVAYEPIWAIGSGTPCTPNGANATMGAIRAAVPGLQDVRILYGGSVKPDNISGFVAEANIDGALVGGASLDPQAFNALLAGAAAEVVR